jgi:hypothetical protein
MKRLSRRIIILAACLAFCAVASAIPWSITDADDGSPANAGDKTVAAWLGGVVNDYNQDHFGAGLLAPGSLLYKLNSDGTSVGGPPPGPGEYPCFGAGTLSITLPVDDYLYLVLHWGGKGGGVWQAFYLGDASPGDEGTYTFDAPGKHGLSSYSYFANPEPPRVPDAGPTLVLLGLALCGVWMMRRKLKA